MKKTFKVQLKPNNKQETKLFLTAHAARFAYNWAIGEENENHDAGLPFIRESELRKRFTRFKKTSDFPERFKTVSNDAMKQGIRDAINAFTRFFEHKADHPRFKSVRKAKPSFYQDVSKIQFTKTHVRIQNLSNSRRKSRDCLNWVRLVERGRIPVGVKYCNPRITYDGLHWWLTVAVDVPDEPRQHQNLKGVGIDLGIEDLAILPDGTKYPNLNKTEELKRLERRRRHLQRVVSRKYRVNNPQIKNSKKGVRYRTSKNTVKAKKRHLKVSRHITNILQEYIKCFVKSVISKNPKFVCMEDLAVKDMMKNRKLSKAIQAQRWGLTRMTMQAVCNEKKIPFVLADRWFPSSKRCICCGNIKKDLTLRDRIYVCDVCGNAIDRDVQAAQNLERYGEEHYVPIT